MMTIPIVSILLLLVFVSVHGNSTVEADINEAPGILGYPGRRRTHEHLPKFSKKEKGKGKGKGEVYVEIDGYTWVYEQKSHKKSKSSKKDKKDKKEKYVYYVTRMPTEAPVHSFPTNKNETNSHSDDIHSSSKSGSEDCPRKSNKLEEIIGVPKISYFILF